MEHNDEIIALLREIRDVGKEHLAAYRTAAAQSIELQQRAVKRAESIGRVYRGALVGSAILIAGIIVLILYLMTFLRR